MSKRVINVDNGTATPPAPATMNDLLNAAESAWKAGERQKAFITLLGAVAMMSMGVAQAMKAAAELHRELADIKSKMKE